MLTLPSLWPKKTFPGCVVTSAPEVTSPAVSCDSGRISTWNCVRPSSVGRNTRISLPVACQSSSPTTMEKVWPLGMRKDCVGPRAKFGTPFSSGPHTCSVPLASSDHSSLKCL